MTRKNKQQQNKMPRAQRIKIQDLKNAQRNIMINFVDRMNKLDTSQDYATLEICDIAVTAQEKINAIDVKIKEIVESVKAEIESKMYESKSRILSKPVDVRKVAKDIQANQEINEATREMIEATKNFPKQEDTYEEFLEEGGEYE